MQDIVKLNPEKVKNVEWSGDHVQYDLELFQLGEDLDASEFIVVNPWLTDPNLYHYIAEIPDTDKCIVWKYQDQWVAKHFKHYWHPDLGYEELEIVKPKLIWRKNFDLDRTMTFEDDPFAVFKPEPWDYNYEMVWYLDPRVNPSDDNIWAISCKPMGRPIKGIKDMGYIMPKINVEFNPHLAKLPIDIDSCYPAYYDLAHECAWKIDEAHTVAHETMWVVKFTPAYRKPKEWKWYGVITPEYEIEYNPEVGNLEYDVEFSVPQWYDLAYEYFWMLDRKHLHNNEEDIWAFKIRYVEDIQGVKEMGYVSPRFSIERNPDLDKLDYDLIYIAPWHDLKYDHYWMLDRKHLHNNEEDIWAFKITACNNPIGSKIHESISPKFKIEYNPVLPKLFYNIDFAAPWYDLNYIHTWMLDKKHTVDLNEDIWAVRVSPVKGKRGYKIAGTVSPQYELELNSDLEGYNFDVSDYIPQYYDLAFTHVLMLDKKYSLDNDIWAARIKYTKSPVGDKYVGVLDPVPRIKYNPALKHLDIKIDYIPPYYDRMYVHTWYLDKEFADGKKIWAAKLLPSKIASGEKEMGEVTPIIHKKLDVVFISYDESNAEENWQRVLEKAPYALRVDGVKGIEEAHRAAAKLVKTDMCFIVDGDAYLTDDWNFNFQPSIFDRDCVYVWNSINPINDLTYGYGGVKLFPTKLLLKADMSTSLDLTTGVASKFKSMDAVSNFTNFNTDEFSTWRSAFRECVKLCYNMKKDPENLDHKDRLEKWITEGEDRPYGDYVADAALEAVKFFNADDQPLTLINDREWLLEKFNEFYSD